MGMDEIVAHFQSATISSIPINERRRREERQRNQLFNCHIIRSARKHDIITNVPIACEKRQKYYRKEA